MEEQMDIANREQNASSQHSQNTQLTIDTTMPQRFSESPHARSKSITMAEGIETYGILNRHAPQNDAYQVGVSEDKGIRRYMEDAHSFVVDFAGVRGQGFFAIFDGHAGKHAAEWCGAHFHEYFLDALRASPNASIPDVLNQTFHNVDAYISRMCEESDGKIHSGCTAVTAFMRIEDASRNQPFLPAIPQLRRLSAVSDNANGDQASPDGSPLDETEDGVADGQSKDAKKAKNGSRLARALKSLSGGSSNPSPSDSSVNTTEKGKTHQTSTDTGVITPPPSTRRVLYTANAGDARGVLCRAGKAVRLTYDHKGSDKQEAKRITDAGGFVMSGRVNGVLAVTRSLGDSSMKEFVVGAPYTTETELCDADEFVILACDGLWDIASDQEAIDLIRHIDNAQQASKTLVDHALARQSNDNVTALVVRFKNQAS